MTDTPTPAVEDMSRHQLQAIIDNRVAEIMDLPEFTLFRCGWRTPTGRVQGSIHWRFADGVGPLDRVGDPRLLLHHTVQGGYDKPWGVEILARPDTTADDNSGVGNCGYIDPLGTEFMDDEKTIPPWWVPLAPAAPITECQAWAAFVGWLTQPPYYLPRYPTKNPDREIWWSRAYDVRQEFGEKP